MAVEEVGGPISQMFDFGKYRPSAIMLIAVNLVPLAGVLFWGWDVFAIVALYWVENVFLGAINVLKMIVASPDRSAMDGKLSGAAQPLLKLFFVPFFMVHYGGFCAAHGFLVVALLGTKGKMPEGPDFSIGFIDNLLGTVLNGPLLLAAVALGTSHLFSFAVNYLGRGEFRKTSVPLLMAQPYGRIFVMHFTLILGAFGIELLGSPVALVAVLVLGKIWMDLKFHLRERGRASRSGIGER